jgi:serine/threonine protein kinase
MLEGLSGLSEAELNQWIEKSLAEHKNTLAAGYQGQTLLYKTDLHQLVIKVPHGRGLIKRFHIAMLRHEYAVYKKISGFTGAPQCYGMVAGQYLVLQFINGLPIRKARPVEEDAFFISLFEFIQHLHNNNIAHMDLKKKDNLLVVDGKMPCIIDFGAAVIRKDGFHPFNHFHYELAKRFDFNAWIKHKYNNYLDSISEADKPYFNKTYTEIYSRKIKRFYKDCLRYIRK